MTTTRLADGTVRTVISSRPSARSLADAWAGLARGHHAGAAEVFLERVFDPETGPEATVGYALATALDGDRQTARVALERALAQHPDLLDEIALTTAMRRALEALIGEAPEKAMLAEKQAD